MPAPSPAESERPSAAARPSGSSVPRPTPEPSDRILTVPNIFTVLRLVLLTPIVIVLLADPGTRVEATIALVVFSSTDWIDGFLARRLGQVSKVGMWLDPIADRLGVAWILIAMLVFGILPWWLPAVIVVIDALILLLGVGRRDRIARMRVVPLGKLRTAVLMVGLPLAALGASTLDAAPTIAVIASVLLAIGALLHVGAGAIYLRALLRPLPSR